MKKILLLLCLLPFIGFAQIGPIETYDKPYELIGRIIYLDKKSDMYYLYIRSDNQFEDYVVTYKIGSNAKEAATSIANLYATLNNKDQRFKVGSYEFCVLSDWYIQVIGLSNKAGNFGISKYEMESSIKKLITDYGANYGEVSIIADDLQYGKFDIVYDYYKMTFSMDLRKNLLPFLSRTYEIGEQLSTDDVMSLQSAAIDGTINCPLLKTLSK